MMESPDLGKLHNVAVAWSLIPPKKIPPIPLIIAPVETEPEHIHLILGGFVNVADGISATSVRKVCEHAKALISRASKVR
jgi:hypothetical protein